MYEKLLNKKLGHHGSTNENRVNNGREVISKKMQELKKEVDMKEMRECTFKPQINEKNKAQRSVNQFFNDQLGYHQKTNDKVEEMRMILEANRQK